MDKEISNRTLAVLLILTIAVSFAGTMLSLNRLKYSSMVSITGADVLTQEGSVQATVTSNTAISFTTSSVSFGTGTVSGDCNNCTMYTPSVNETPGCCIGFSVPASGLVLENVGNRNASISLNFSNDAAAIIGGTSPAFQMNITESKAGSCKNTSDAGSALAPTWKEVFGDVPTDDPEVCGVFQPNAANDELTIDIRIRIPDNSMTGLRNTTVTATATTV